MLDSFKTNGSSPPTPQDKARTDHGDDPETEAGQDPVACSRRSPHEFLAVLQKPEVSQLAINMSNVPGFSIQSRSIEREPNSFDSEDTDIWPRTPPSRVQRVVRVSVAEHVHDDARCFPIAHLVRRFERGSLARSWQTKSVVQRSISSFRADRHRCEDRIPGPARVRALASGSRPASAQ